MEEGEKEKKGIKLIFNNSEKELPKDPSSFEELQILFFQLFPEANRNNIYCFHYECMNLSIEIHESNLEGQIETIYETGSPIIYVELENKNDETFGSLAKSIINEGQEQNDDLSLEKNSSENKEKNSFDNKFNDPDFFNKIELAKTEIINKNEDENEDNEENEENEDNDDNLNEIELLKEELNYTKRKLDEERAKTESLEKKVNEILDIEKRRIEKVDNLKKENESLLLKNKQLENENQKLKTEKENANNQLIEKNKKLHNELVQN